MSNQMPRSVTENIRTVIQVEEEQRNQRGLKDRIADAIGSFAGTVTFVLLHLAWFAVWAAINAGLIPGVPKFDPYPFQLLCMIVSLEGVLLSTFVLIKQNRMTLSSDRRNHLDLQINLLTEKEVTKLIQMMERMAAHMGVDAGVVDAEARELAEVTAVGDLAREVGEEIPEQT
jgi:uncharacterized membrane protein